jgi:DNA-binding SARP family transcriptional activator/streptogramin lyase
MEFRILGPLEVVDDGNDVSIRRGKEQALLAYLLLHANEVVPSGRLIDALWDERPPATASKILHNAVSHLRRDLGDGRLVTRDPGYLLRVERGELDAEEFERLAQEGRSEEALALWRGPPLLGLQDEAFVDDARRRLDELRLGVIEDRIDQDLEDGKYAELIPELEQLVRQQPLRERLRGQLMRALYGTGRQADALEAYRGARRTLSSELGLEPGPELQELERRILNQELEVAPPKRPRDRPPPSRRRRRRVAAAAVGALLLAGAIVGIVFATQGEGKPIVATANSVAVVDPAANRVLDVTPVGTQPRGIAADSTAVWIANSRNGTVQRLDPESHSIVQTVGLGANAIDVALGGGDLWVATGIDDTLVRIGALDGERKDTIRLPKDEVSAAAWSVAYGRGAVYVTSGGSVAKVDSGSGSFVFKSACCHGPFDVAVGLGSVWVADFGINLAVVSQRTGDVITVIPLGAYTDTVVTGFGSVWVTVTDNRGLHASLLRLDPQTHSVLGTIPIGPPTRSHYTTLPIAIGAGSVWVGDGDAGNIVRVSPTSGTVTKTIHVGGKLWALAFGAGKLWATVN